jgi:hypothetical protein
MLVSILENWPDEQLVIADGFDEAVIGIDVVGERIIYSVQKVIDILIERDGMDEQEAIDWYEYNMQSTYVGEHTPIWCEDRFI